MFVICSVGLLLVFCFDFFSWTNATMFDIFVTSLTERSTKDEGASHRARGCFPLRLAFSSPPPPLMSHVPRVQDTKISEIMRPRVEVVAIEANSTMMDLYNLHQVS